MMMGNLIGYGGFGATTSSAGQLLLQPAPDERQITTVSRQASWVRPVTSTVTPAGTVVPVTYAPRQEEVISDEPAVYDDASLYDDAPLYDDEFIESIDAPAPADDGTTKIIAVVAIAAALGFGFLFWKKRTKG